MTAVASSELRVSEQVVRRTPLGLRVWDTAAATHSIDGLQIDVSQRSRPTRSTRAFVNASGIYCVQDLPGLATFERDAADDPAAWDIPAREYRIVVRDPAGRFLPLAFDASLPMRGLLDPWLTASPLSAPLPPLESPLSPVAAPLPALPLFSSPSRPVPGALAVLRAELREHPSGRPAAWCLLELAIGGVVRGLGLADRKGRVMVLFPYPPSPRPTLTSPISPLASPPSPRNDFRWTLSLTAYYRGQQADTTVPEVPDLADLTAQLDSPRQLLESLSPPLPLGELPLEYRVPVTARTHSDAPEESSYLFIDMT
jgi:hypothetical protein